MSRHRAQAIAALAVALLSLSALVVANQLLERGDDNSDARLSWSLLKALGPSKRSGHSLTIIGGGIYVFGGCYLDTACYSDLYIFNLAQKAWLRPVARGHLPDARGHHTASAVNGTLWIVGGSNDGSFRGDVYTFDTQTWLWSKPLIRGEHKLTPRHGHTAVVQGGKIIIYGGYGDKGYLSDVYILDTVNRVWIKPQKVTGVPPSPRSGHVSVRHKNRMYVFGGVSDATGDTNTFHAYDIVANDWLAPSQLLNSGPIPSARHGAVAAMWKDMMFLVGGCNFKKRECYNDTTVLDMGTMQWNLMDVRSEFVANKTKPFDPKDLIDDKTLQMFSAAPPAPPPVPPAVAKAKEDVNLAIEAKQMAQFAAEQAALAAKNKTGSSFLQLGARHRMRHRSRDGPSGNVLPPLMDIGEEAKLPNVDGTVQWHMSPVGGLAGGFHGNTGDLYIFGGCFLEKSCSFKLLQLTIPKTYKPPVDPFPIPNTVTKSGNALSAQDTNSTNGLAPMQPVKELPPAVAPVIPPVPRFAQLNTVDVDRFAELGDNLAALALAASQRAPSVGKSNTDIDDVDSPIARLLSSGRPTTFVEEQPPSSESATPPRPSHPARRRRARRPIKKAPAPPPPAPTTSEAAEESAKEAHIEAKKPRTRTRSRGHPLKHHSHAAHLSEPVIETSQLSVWGIVWRVLLALGVIGTLVLCCFKAYLYYDEKRYTTKRSDLRNVADSDESAEEAPEEEEEEEEAPHDEAEEEEEERPARKGKKKVTIKEPASKTKKSSLKSSRAQQEEETAEANAVLGAALGAKKVDDEPQGPSPEKLREYQEYARRIATSVDIGADYSDDD